jgi:hypothetical protein
MLKPSPAELLEGVADALAETVLGELDRGVARNQVQAAIGIVRRCSAALAVHGPILHADCLDISSSLRTMAEADPTLVIDEAAFDAALESADRVLGGRYPSVVELTDLDLELRDVLASASRQSEATGSAKLGPLRELLERMLKRESDLGLSPW